MARRNPTTGKSPPVCPINLSNDVAVGMRVRPLDDDRGSQGSNVKVDAVAGRIEIERKNFEFVHVYDRPENLPLLEPIGKPLVENIIEGYNGTFIVYGQTGSGKTYTMGELDKIGTRDEGVGHLMIRELFRQLDAAHEDRFAVRMQYVQLYLEEVYDLLATGERASVGLEVKMDRKRRVFIEGATQEPLANAEECFKVLQRASGNLKFASTKMNRHSSRSHVICQLIVDVEHAHSTATEGAGQVAGHANTGNDKRGFDGGPSNLTHWRQGSVDAISATLSRQRSLIMRTTTAMLTLCDLAGSEDIKRSGQC